MGLQADIDLNNKNRQNALNRINNTYDSAINDADKFYQARIDQVNDYAETQKQYQQEMTDQAIDVINQQKGQAKEDYKREQSGAYVDWQKQADSYGANAEKMAASGLAGTGYSESSQVSMYNTYQNRVATARETYNRAVLNYDNAIKDAMLQNNVKLAEIANQALSTQLQLSLEGFQYKNSMLIEKNNQIQNTLDNYFDRAMQFKNLDLSRKGQKLDEKRFKEDKRQFNKQFTENKRQFNKSFGLDKEQLDEERRQFNKSYGLKSTGKSSGGGRRSKGGSTTKKTGKSTGGKTTGSKKHGSIIKPKPGNKKGTTGKKDAVIKKDKNKKMGTKVSSNKTKINKPSYTSGKRNDRSSRNNLKKGTSKKSGKIKKKK